MEAISHLDDEGEQHKGEDGAAETEHLRHETATNPTIICHQTM
jgi:hypothetical protein